MFCEVRQHRFQILRVDEQKLLVIRDLVSYRQQVCLRVVQIQDLGHELRAHLTDSRSERNALFAVDIVDRNRKASVLELLPDIEPVEPFLHALAVLSGDCDTRHVSLDVGEECGNAQLRERLRQHLERDRLACACRAADKSMSICHRRIQIDLLIRPFFRAFFREINHAIIIHNSTSCFIYKNT